MLVVCSSFNQIPTKFFRMIDRYMYIILVILGSVNFWMLFHLSCGVVPDYLLDKPFHCTFFYKFESAIMDLSNPKKWNSIPNTRHSSKAWANNAMIVLHACVVEQHLYHILNILNSHIFSIEPEITVLNCCNGWYPCTDVHSIHKGIVCILNKMHPSFSSIAIYWAGIFLRVLLVL